MAYIMSATVEGLAGRREPIHLELDRHVNIVWGLNGTGKSTLLKVLHSALNDNAELIARLPVREASVEIANEVTDVKIRRRLAYVREPDRQQSLFRDAPIFDEDSDETANERRWVTEYSIIPERPVRRVQHSYLSISRLVEEATPRRYMPPTSYREMIDETFLDELFARQVTDRWRAYHAESLGKVRDIQQEGLGRILSVLFGGAKASKAAPLEELDASHAYEMTRDFLRSQGMRVTFSRESFTDRLRRERELQEVVEHIRTVTRRIGQALRPQRDLEELVSSLYLGNKQISFSPRGIQVRVDDTEIPLYALSSGEKQMLQMLVICIGSGSSPVIIDEPELSLHVDWQERLVKSLRVLNPECQLIFATHSPEIMAHVADRHIREL